jgi:alcohol dehydrogenase (cytochrome c)
MPLYRLLIREIAVAMRTTWLLVGLTAVLLAQPRAGTPAHTFAANCTVCHGGDAGGTDRAPAILPYLASHSDQELIELVRSGRPERGMPKFEWNDAELNALAASLRAMTSGGGRAGGGGRGGRGAPAFQPRPAKLQLTGGGTLDGTLTSQVTFSATLLTPDGKFHLLSRSGELYTERPVEPKQDWLGYDGGYTGNRYSPLTQISLDNVSKLAAAWVFPVPNAPRLEVTPVVVDGVMYITGPNEAYALDAGTGRQIWAFRTPRTSGLLSEAAGGANRGVALSGNRLFMVTDNAHLLALDRFTGRKVWDVVMGDIKEGYSATAAPMVIDDLVLSGIAGGEEGARGFVDAYRIETGERAWRYWTIPLRGEKGAETWIGNALEHGCGATWITGSYDPALAQTYWTIGNPCPDYNGDERKGDNLWTNSVVALDVKTGTLKWYFQFTPHDTHDWDSNGPLILADEMWEGKPRKLMLHADINGFFFVLDRSTGELLRASEMGPQNWTTGFGKDGKPALTENYEAKDKPVQTCRVGAVKWASASFDPASKLFFTRVSGGCSTVMKDPNPPQMGERFFGGRGGGGFGQGGIQAIDIRTGKKAWEYQLAAGAGSGTLATAGGLLFFGESGGTFVALNSKSGAPVWHFETGQNWRASPMTYMVSGTQYVVLAGTGGIFSFALPR